VADHEGHTRQVPGPQKLPHVPLIMAGAARPPEDGGRAGQLSREPRSVSVAADDPTWLGAPFVRGRGVGLGPPLRRMSTATVSASRPAGRDAGFPPPLAAEITAGVPLGLIDTGLPGAGRRGVIDGILPAVPTVVVGASEDGAGPGFAAGEGEPVPGFADCDGAPPREP
jgi:hypothetical protein